MEGNKDGTVSLKLFNALPLTNPFTHPPPPSVPFIR